MGKQSAALRAAVAAAAKKPASKKPASKKPAAKKPAAAAAAAKTTKKNKSSIGRNQGGGDRKQWKFLDAASRKVSQYYKWTLCGDSPEWMPLDSSIFSYLIEAIQLICNATGHRKRAKLSTDQIKYSFATHGDAEGTLTEAWFSGSVSDELIIQDIEKVERALVMVIERQGTIVKELNRVRKGHRKDASTLALKKMLPKPAYEGMQEQLKSFRGMSGSRRSGSRR